MRPLETKKRPLGWIFLGMVAFLLIGVTFFYFSQLIPDPTIVNSRGEITLGNNKFNKPGSNPNAVAVKETTAADSLRDTTTGLAANEISFEEALSEGEVIDPNMVSPPSDSLLAVISPDQEIPSFDSSPVINKKPVDEKIDSGEMVASIDKNVLELPKSPQSPGEGIDAPVKLNPQSKPTEKKPILTQRAPADNQPTVTKPAKPDNTNKAVPFTAKNKGDKMKTMTRIISYFQNMGHLHKIVGGKLVYQRVTLPEVSNMPLDITFYMLKGDGVGDDRLLVGLFKMSNGGSYLSPEKFPSESRAAQQLVSKLAR